jgi:hypothetical protein
MDSHISVATAPWFGNLRAIEVGSLSKTAHQMRFTPELGQCGFLIRTEASAAKVEFEASWRQWLAWAKLKEEA